MTEIVKELNARSFDKFVKNGNCIIDFWAEWCMPCKELAPVLESAALALKRKVKFAKVNVEGNDKLTQRFLIMSVPTLIFFKKGQEVNRINGLVSKDEIIKTAKESF